MVNQVAVRNVARERRPIDEQHTLASPREQHCRRRPTATRADHDGIVHRSSASYFAEPRGPNAYAGLGDVLRHCRQGACGSPFGMSIAGRWSRLATRMAASYTKRET